MIGRCASGRRLGPANRPTGLLRAKHRRHRVTLTPESGRRQEAAQEGTRHHGRLEAVSGLDQRQAAVQAEDQLRVGGWAADSERLAKTGRVFGAGRRGYDEGGAGGEDC